MAFWDEISSDMAAILDDPYGPSILVTYMPHVPPEEFMPEKFQVILISHGRDDDSASNKVGAYAYFHRDDIATPQYQDTLTDEEGNSWKLMKDAGSNGDLLRWEVEKDTRSIMGRQRS